MHRKDARNEHDDRHDASARTEQLVVNDEHDHNDAGASPGAGYFGQFRRVIERNGQHLEQHVDDQWHDIVAGHRNFEHHDHGIEDHH